MTVKVKDLFGDSRSVSEVRSLITEIENVLAGSNIDSNTASLVIVLVLYKHFRSYLSENGLEVARKYIAINRVLEIEETINVIFEV